MSRASIHSRTAAGAFALLLPLALASPPAFAQSRETPPKEAPRPPAVKPPEAAIPEADGKGPEVKPGEGSGRKTSLDKLPQTAEEKARALADLYAHLATAENEEEAKRFSDRIERLWHLSGSDTVSLLMQRAGKAIKEKKLDLARKFLDLVVELAPDYAEGFNQRAYLNFSENNFQAAVGDLRRALALDPSHYKALEGLAQIWRETGDKRGAFRVMRQLLDVHPHAPGAKAVFDELKREVDGQGI